MAWGTERRVSLWWEIEMLWAAVVPAPVGVWPSGWFTVALGNRWDPRLILGGHNGSGRGTWYGKCVDPSTAACKRAWSIIPAYEARVRPLIRTTNFGDQKTLIAKTVGVRVVLRCLSTTSKLAAWCDIKRNFSRKTVVLWSMGGVKPCSNVIVSHVIKKAS